MIDASESNAARLRQRFPWDRIAIEQAIVTRENVNDLLSRHGLVDDIDFASVDIDGDDYWIWESLTVCRPRLLIIEYNSLLGPDRAVVVPYQSPSHKDVATAVETGYYGASLSALARLGASKDYRLVAVEPRGVNAFFLRNDVGPEIPACAPTEAFRMFENYQKRVAAGGIDHVYARIEQEGWPLVRLDVRELEQPPNSGLVSTARCCGHRRHRQTNSVRVCSPASRRVTALRPRFAGLTALTPAPRTLVQTGSCRRCPLRHPLHIVVDIPSRIDHFRATVDS